MLSGKYRRHTTGQDHFNDNADDINTMAQSTSYEREMLLHVISVEKKILTKYRQWIIQAESVGHFINLGAVLGKDGSQ